MFMLLLPGIYANILPIQFPHGRNNIFIHVIFPPGGTEEEEGEN